jgi:FtsH-binding integral membrane protein
LATLAQSAAPPRARPVRRTRFYFWLSLACLAVGIGGFAPTYWLQVPAGTFTGAPLMHIHAIVFTGWLLLLVGQNWRIAQGRLDHHKAWGLVGISLATAMLVIGWLTAIVGLEERLAGGFGDKSRAFLIVPLFSVTTFFAFVVAAIANIRRPEWHKRFIFVGTAIALMAAVARFFLIYNKGFAPGVRCLFQALGLN